MPLAQTGNPVDSSPARSRTAPSLTSPATPRTAMRAHRMSPQKPASVTRLASITAMQPAGISSIAARVDFGELQEAGVARSSRAGMKRTVKARPTMRGWLLVRENAPRIQTLRRPFFSRTVVSVAVVTFARATKAAESLAVDMVYSKDTCLTSIVF